MMKPEPLPDGVSIEITASPNLPTSSLTGDGFKHPSREEARRVELGPSARRSALATGADVVDLGAPDNLVARNPQNVETQVDVERRRLLRDDLARHPLTVLENDRLKFGRSPSGETASEQ